MSKDFPYLRAWNVFLGGNPTYNLDIARESKAPPTAIYQSHEGRWVTFEEIKSSDTKTSIEELVVRFK